MKNLNDEQSAYFEYCKQLNLMPTSEGFKQWKEWVVSQILKK